MFMVWYLLQYWLWHRHCFCVGLWDLVAQSGVNAHISSSCYFCIIGAILVLKSPLLLKDFVCFLIYGNQLWLILVSVVVSRAAASFLCGHGHIKKKKSSSKYKFFFPTLSVFLYTYLWFVVKFHENVISHPNETPTALCHSPAGQQNRQVASSRDLPLLDKGYERYHVPLWKRTLWLEINP